MNGTDEFVILRPPELKDVEQLYQYRNDRSVTSQLGGHSSGYSRQDLIDWIERHRHARDEVLWTIATALDDRCIGHVGLYGIDYRARRAEFGILIGDAEFHGKGLGKRVTADMISYGFDQLNLIRIGLTVIETNERAIALYKRLGFVVEGRERSGDFRRGRHIDIILMSILRDEWCK